MALAPLSNDEFQIYKAFVVDLLTCNGIAPNKIRADWYINAREKNGIADNFKTLYDALCNPVVNIDKFRELDKVLAPICKFGVLFTTDYSENRDKWDVNKNKIVRLPMTQGAEFFARLAQQIDQYWDNELVTPIEMKLIITKTKTGEALYNAGRFTFNIDLSAVNIGSTSQNTATGTTQNTATGTTQNTRASTGTRAANGSSQYKQAGPLSAVATTVVSPGKKDYFTGNTVYYLANKATNKVIFVTLLTVKGEAIHPDRAAKIKYGTGHANPDATLYFETPQEADTARSYCESKFNTTLNIIGDRADRNGYFEVQSEVGAAYVKARVLNEEISEDLNTVSESTQKYDKYYGTNIIKDIKTFEENFNKYRD